MKCIKCGQEINDDAFMCSYCGTLVQSTNNPIQGDELLAPPTTANAPVQVNNINNSMPVQPEQVVTEETATNEQQVPQAVTPQISNTPKRPASPILEELEKDEEVKRVDTGLLSAFGIVNIILYVGSMIGLYILLKDRPDANMKSILMSFTIVYFYLLCSEKILIKADIPWWHMFIPILNIYSFYKVSFSENTAKTIMFFTIVVTFVIGYLIFQNSISSLNLALQIGKVAFGIVIPIIEIVQLFLLGRNFGMSGLLTLFLSPIMIPIIAFSACEYKG